MKSNFRQMLESGKVIIFDGGMGTELAAKGLQPGAQLNVDAADAVMAIHRAYREAGADVLLTNTFGANPIALEKRYSERRAKEYIAAACKIAREAAGTTAFVAGDLGPTGEFIEPYGNYSESEMRRAYEQVAAVLVEGGVDLLIVETMTDLKEMTIAVSAARAAGKKLPLIASMSFDPIGDDFRTSTGLAAADAVAAMQEAGADIVGTNCGSVSPAQVAEIVRLFREITDLPILAEPNAGLPKLHLGVVSYNLDPATFAKDCVGIAQAGARLIGGCCGTTPAHVRALAQAVKAGGT